MSLENVFKTNTIFTIRLFGLSIPVSDSIVMIWVVMAALIVLSVIFTRRLKTIPTGRQNAAEIVVETVNNLVRPRMSRHWKAFAPYYGTILLFLVAANMAGIFNIFPTAQQLYRWTGLAFFSRLPDFAIEPPTKDLNVTLTMALMSVLLVPIAGISIRGFKGWLKSFLRPMPVMLPFNILDYGTRTLSLSLRLFGNIFAGVIIMEMLLSGAVFIKPVIPLASAFFDLFDAALQAYIFVFLSIIYVSEVIEQEE